MNKHSSQVDLKVENELLNDSRKWTENNRKEEWLKNGLDTEEYKVMILNEILRH